ncbi:MAG: DNA-binding transcriptional regulator [Planctomycetota bacterium]|nr:MAG: DNA-binding transcriptional regulator [Planctomycetota bacterium]
MILLIDTARAYGRGLLRGIAKYSDLHGPWIFYWKAPFYREPAGLRVTLSRLKKLDADGIIMREQKETGKILAMGLPTIVSPYSRRFSGLPNIVPDDGAIAKVAAEHLLNLGLRYFAYCGFEDMFAIRNRGEIFRKTIADAGLRTYVYKEPRSRARRQWEVEQNIMAEWLRSLPKPVGVMACNDDRGRQVIEACKIAGLHVPEEVAVIGVDYDDLVCSLSNPPLSSVALNFERAGYEAAELLGQLMAGKKPGNQTIVVPPTHIVARQSTDVLEVEDYHVARAVRFIRQHAKEPIQVEDVVSVAAVSRRGLERRFRRVLSRSVLDEIRRVHVEQVTRMLIETNLSIAQIALTLGYTGVAHIARYFRREKGMSALEYRKRFGGK